MSVGCQFVVLLIAYHVYRGDVGDHLAAFVLNNLDRNVY